MIVTNPFPHVVVDGMWDPVLLSAVADEFPDPDSDGWCRYHTQLEAKLEGPQRLWGPATTSFFEQLAGHAAGIGTLFDFADVTLETIGGGYHLIPPGGYLEVHTDFNRHPTTGLYRVANILVFLNPGWKDKGGRLELWDDHGPKETIAPEFNRTVMFATSASSWHGHPRPATRWRKSVAAYLFSPVRPDTWAADQSTVFHASRRP